MAELFHVGPGAERAGQQVARDQAQQGHAGVAQQLPRVVDQAHGGQQGLGHPGLVRLGVGIHQQQDAQDARQANGVRDRGVHGCCSRWWGTPCMGPVARLVAESGAISRRALC
ncbi:hypothetical protein FQZ97_1163100 [compost metagenome]